MVWTLISRADGVDADLAPGPAFAPAPLVHIGGGQRFLRHQNQNRLRRHPRLQHMPQPPHPRRRLARPGRPVEEYCRVERRLRRALLQFGESHIGDSSGEAGESHIGDSSGEAGKCQSRLTPRPLSVRDAQAMSKAGVGQSRITGEGEPEVENAISTL